MRRPGDWPLLLLTSVVLVSGALIGLGALSWLNWRLRSEPFWSWVTPATRVGPEPLEIVKVALTIVAGVGGLVALTIAYRRQVWLETDEAGKRDEQAAKRAKQAALHERYGAAVAQLGHEQATVRLGGVYALANLANQWHTQRQQCVDVLCAYLRIPWQPPKNPATQPTQTGDADQDPQAEDETAHSDFSSAGESEVRKTIIRVIADHLRLNPDGPTAPGPWSDLTLDFTGAILPESHFRLCTFTGNTDWSKTHFLNHADFKGATFTGDARFDGAAFKHETWFAGARFAGAASFGRATFKGAADFDNAAFKHETWFARARFEGDVWFEQARFAGAARFHHAKFAGEAGFTEARFAGRVYFSGARFEGAARFRDAKFEGDAWFDKATFKGAARFGEATFERSVSEEIHRFLSSEQLARMKGAPLGEAEGDDPNQ